MTRKRDVDGLAKLSDLQFRAAQAELAEILTREAGLRTNLAQLVQSKQDQANAPRQPDEAALVAGADLRWHQWVDQRRAVINAELAEVLVLKQTRLAVLRQSFGRNQAAQALQTRTRILATRDARRRSDYES